MAADRVAGGKEGAEQVLAVNLAGDDHPGRPGRHRQDALADRARLPGAEAGTGPRPLRRAGLAWLSPSRHLVHRGLRLPRSRAEPFSPSRPFPRPSTCVTRRLAAARAFPCERSVMSRSRSPRDAAVSRSPWLAVYPAALAVSGPTPAPLNQIQPPHTDDTVRLRACANTRKRTQPAWTGEHSASEAIPAGVGVERSGR